MTITTTVSTLIIHAKNACENTTTPKDGSLPNPSVCWDFIGVDLGFGLYNGLYTIVLIICGIAALIGAGFAAFGKIAKHQNAFTGGLITVGCAIGAAAIATGVGALISWGASQSVALISPDVSGWTSTLL